MDFNKIDEQMREYVRNNEMAGGALIIRQHGDIVYKNKWGYADIAAKKPVEYNTIFKMASVSKVFTAVGILKLIEQGKLGLDDEIAKYLPEFQNIRVVSDKKFAPENLNAKRLIWIFLTLKESKVKTVSANRMITVRDLLTHTSGMGMGAVGLILGMKLKSWEKDDLETRIHRWAKIPIDFQPGTQTGYSALMGFDTLGRLCEVISGKPFAEYMNDEVFKPIGMMDATFYPDDEQKTRIPPLYKKHKNGLKDVTGTKADIRKLAKLGEKASAGSAGVYATIEDMDKFAYMLSHEGEINGTQILKPETVKSIYTERAYDKDLEFGAGMKWGLGMLVREDPEKAGITTAKNTYGWSGAYGTHFFVSPNEGLSVVFAMNRSDIGGSSSPIAKRLEELVFEEKY